MSKHPNYGLFALAAAVAGVGALWLGVPIGTLVLLAFVVACPLMMMLMMGGMHGGGMNQEHPSQHDQSHRTDSHL